MAVLKCKMCGGSLEIQEGTTVYECEYCGSKQTIPSIDDEGLQVLFNRANILRMKSEFDKAADIYEKILQKKDTEAEAYWGLILCKYGIEYVEDPKTYKRIPTCHRTSYDAVTADEDYKNALKYAGLGQREIYEEEAKKIDEIQKGILAVAEKEDPYDVFICYKETDDSGKRTPDSVVANDIYHQLTMEGFKVFYAAISLEDKLGTEYEPYIFSALNTAKVMLAIGTKPEYFNAVWVKNEWSRFLKLMQKDRSRLLIPCYRDMDPYELPEEFAHLQAQDMSKIGFINDIVRGLKKVILKDDPKTALKGSVVVNDSVSVGVSSLLRRTAMFLEDGNWNRAHELCEQILNVDPENAQAYVYELMGDLKVSTQSELVNCSQPFETNNNYQKAIRFASPELSAELQDYVVTIKERNEIDRKNDIYSEATKKMACSTSEVSYREVVKLFQSISGWKDADDKREEALQNAEAARKDYVYQQAINLASSSNSKLIAKGIQKLESIPGWKDSDALVKEYEVKLSNQKELEAKEERKKQHITEMRKQYDAEYSLLINSRMEKEKQLKDVSNNKYNLQKESTFGPTIAVVIGAFATFIAIIGFVSKLGIGLSIFCLVMGILNLWMGLSAISFKKQRLEMLEKKETEIMNNLDEISRIPSFEQFCDSISKEKE